MQRGLGVVGQLGHQCGDGVGSAGVFFRGADVGQGLALGVVYLVDVGIVKHGVP